MSWQPIETAPTDGTRVLLAYWHQWGAMDKPALRVQISKFDRVYGRAGWLMENTFGDMFNTPAYWMPLPPPPSGDGGK